jgi:hypothetical protein
VFEINVNVRPNAHSVDLCIDLASQLLLFEPTHMVDTCVGRWRLAPISS